MSAASVRTPVLSVTGVSKSFGANHVLKGVGFQLFAGEVLALVGENGAGKSTLMGIVSGGLPYDVGAIALGGEAYRPDSPSAAIGSGVAIAHQETAIMPDLSVAENIFFRREPRRFGLIRQKALHDEARRLLAELGFAIDAGRLGHELSAAGRQMVEIARAVSLGSRLLILDEPTASLSAADARIVLDLMTKLKARGTAVIFISHRTPEIMEAADRVVVLKDGALTLEAVRGAFSRDDLIESMVGRKLENIFPERPASLPGAPVAFALDAAAADRLGPLSLSLRRGEVLGIAGLEGQGQRPLAHALCGFKPFRSGRIELGGRPLAVRSTADAIRAGIASIPDDRKHDGLALDLAVRTNLSLFAIRETSRLGMLPLDAERRFAESARARFKIRSTDLEQPARQLSGGNQQKVVFARWLARLPKLLVLFEPTKGVDVQSKSEIYALVNALSAQGVAVILISSDLLELIGLSDRIVTLFEGRITGEIARVQFSEERIMRMAAGTEDEEPAHAA